MAILLVPVVSRPTLRKVEAIRNASSPQNASDIKSLLHMTQYVSRFIPNYATITAPLRLFTRQDMPWKWEQEQQAGKLPK